jgi:hypothetical protein
MPTYEDFDRDYWAPDREQVLQGMRTPTAQAMPEMSQQPSGPAWDRSAFRDQWMSSGVQNVPDMQNWLKNTGWGNQVRMGGSKGDLMYLPSGEVMDTVLAAGLGGNRGGPQWTGRGNWDPNTGGGYTPYGGGGGQQQWGGQPQYGGMGPSPQMMQGGPMRTPGWPTGSSQMYQTYGQQGPNRQMMQNQQNRMFQQNRQQRMQQPRGMQGQQPRMQNQQMQQPNYSQNRMYY